MENKKIPAREMPDTEKIEYAEENSPFVDITKYSGGKILVDMQYLKRGRRGAIATAYLRKEAADRLLQALAFLPAGYTFKIFDAWRPYEVQKSLYEEYFERLKAEFPALSEGELHKQTRTFVSFPDKTKKFAYVHSSGGAVDLTLVDENGVDADMGTAFDDFSDLSSAAALEEIEGLGEARVNRRTLYFAMIRAGFTNYPSEWWHYDFGDIFWAAATGKPVKYASVYTEEEMILGE